MLRVSCFVKHLPAGVAIDLLPRRHRHLACPNSNPLADEHTMADTGRPDEHTADDSDSNIAANQHPVANQYNSRNRYNTSDRHGNIARNGDSV